jgi:hypothetical protein
MSEPVPTLAGQADFANRSLQQYVEDHLCHAS